MAWGYHDWLTDRVARQKWMRSVALAQLTEQILRTPALAIEALACVLDEVFGDANPAKASRIDADVAEDLRRVDEWVQGALALARAQAVSFQSLAIVLSDMAPYRLRLALVNRPVRGEAEWADAITWRSSDRVPSALLDGLLPLFAALDEPVRVQADYVVPLAYTAFLLRDVLRARAGAWEPVREATIIYAGGDHMHVPLM